MEKKLLVGYGTLLNVESLGHSIGEDSATQKELIPVVVKGYKRLFNLRPDHYVPGNKMGIPGAEEAGAANVEPSEEHTFNALAFYVTEEEVQALARRERYYELSHVKIYAFGTEEDLGMGYVWESKPDARWINNDTSKLLPLWKSYALARNGAYHIGQDFGEYYDRTTFLGDGETLMVEFYKDHLDNMEVDDEPLFKDDGTDRVLPDE